MRIYESREYSRTLSVERHEFMKYRARRSLAVESLQRRRIRRGSAAAAPGIPQVSELNDLASEKKGLEIKPRYFDTLSPSPHLSSFPLSLSQYR